MRFSPSVSRTWKILATLVVCVIAIVVGYCGYHRATTTTFTAYFASVNGLYHGDPVRVLGVNVGRVEEITPRTGDVKVTFDVDASTPIPANARAVIVAQSLVSGRFIQLSPVYSGGPQLADGAAIPMERTAIPMEWDDVKKQLDALTKAVGPAGADKGSAARVIDTAADNLDGNGAAINTSITELSDVMTTLASGRGDLFATISSLRKLTDALATSHEQLVQFNGRIASVSDVLSSHTTDLDEAMSKLDSAMSDIGRFIDRNRHALTASVSALADTTKILADKDAQVRALLHSAPNELANFYNIYNPLTGALSGVFGLGMGNNLITLLCGTMAANDRPGQSEAEVDHCVDVLAPVLAEISVAYPPFLSDPVTGISARPSQLTYQNPDVKARAQQGIRDKDSATRRSDGPLGSLLVPWGGEG
ncbi:MAG: MCE family protein [Gordonia sp. (in: high G+C Gram-positive bacteria)]